jgi:hypothetical protein
MRRFHWILLGIAAAAVSIRLLYVYVLSPDVRGIGDWFYFHWQANLIATGHGFIEPFTYMFKNHEAIPSASHPPPSWASRTRTPTAQWGRWSAAGRSSPSGSSGSAWPASGSGWSPRASAAATRCSWPPTGR